MPAVRSRTIRLFSYRRILLASGVFWAAIAVALIVLWVQSCNRYLAVEVKNSEGRFGVSIVYGVLNFVCDRSGMFLNHPTDWSLIAVPAQVLPDPSEVFRFHHKPFRPIRQGSIDVRFPVAGPVVFAAAIAIFSFWRRAKAFPKGNCTLCGYNLYGNTSGLCPECGAEAKGVPTAPEPESGPSPTRWQRVLRATWLTLVGATGLAILVWMVSIGWAWQLDRMKPGNVAVVAPSLAPSVPSMVGPWPSLFTTELTDLDPAPLATYMATARNTGTMSAEELHLLELTWKFLDHASLADPKMLIHFQRSRHERGQKQAVLDPTNWRKFVLDINDDGTLSLRNLDMYGRLYNLYSVDEVRFWLPPDTPRLARALTFLAVESGAGSGSVTESLEATEQKHDVIFAELSNGVWYIGLNREDRYVDMVPVYLNANLDQTLGNLVP